RRSRRPQHPRRARREFIPDPRRPAVLFDSVRIDAAWAGRRTRGAWAVADARSAVEDRPADVVAQPLVVEDELPNRLRELGALPPALESPCAVALALRRAGTC